MVGFGSKGVKSSVGKRTIVGVGDMLVSSNSDETISTFALGSCVGVAAFDEKSGVGGILHVMLPNSKISPEKAKTHPHVFADSGLKSFQAALIDAGAEESDLKIVLAGGASVMSENDVFKIGIQNIEAVEGLVTDLSWEVVARELGGLTNRSMHLVMRNGMLSISQANEKKEVSLT